MSSDASKLVRTVLQIRSTGKTVMGTKKKKMMSTVSNITHFTVWEHSV